MTKKEKKQWYLNKKKEKENFIKILDQLTEEEYQNQIHKVFTKLCNHCEKEYEYTSNYPNFCSVECGRSYRENLKEKRKNKIKKEDMKLSNFWYNDMTYSLWMDAVKEGLERLDNIQDENGVDHEVFCLKVSVNALEELLKKYEERID